MSGQTINTEAHSKYLGVMLDKSLSFYTHLNVVKYILNRENGKLAKLKH